MGGTGCLSGWTAASMAHVTTLEGRVDNEALLALAHREPHRLGELLVRRQHHAVALVVVVAEGEGRVGGEPELASRGHLERLELGGVGVDAVHVVVVRVHHLRKRG